MSGSLLARQTGFRAAHISNVLNRKRLLSLEGLDRVLAATGLSIEKMVAFHAPADTRTRLRKSETVSVPIVSAAAALYQPQLSTSSSQILHLPAAQLRENRARPAPLRAHWQRYLALVLDAEMATPMAPLLSSGTLVVIDRHFTSLASYREPHPTLHAINFSGRLLLRFVSLEDGHLVLRPASPLSPVRLLRLGTHDSPADYIIGRACLLLSSV
ncbi:MAG TPA: hypothetical protein VNU94_01415 [Acidobacteriaceae bacterium]|nr:hypothetical protein [Acidobacteriaceae bacterium]